jgi:hypothetical protein
LQARLAFKALCAPLVQAQPAACGSRVKIYHTHLTKRRNGLEHLLTFLPLIFSRCPELSQIGNVEFGLALLVVSLVIYAAIRMKIPTKLCFSVFIVSAIFVAWSASRQDMPMALAGGLPMSVFYIKLTISVGHIKPAVYSYPHVWLGTLCGLAIFFGGFWIRDTLPIILGIAFLAFMYVVSWIFSR